MDSDENDLDNLFENYEGDNEEPVTEKEVDPNPSEPSNNAEKIPVPKRIVKNPRLKFNADRLCGERGIPVLLNHFKDIKFKGKGHEVEDLNKMMSTLEHWCHRLFPSMKFDDCLRQIEKLGKKRPVQTCLRKIRMDMPILNSDFVHDDEDNDDIIRSEPDVEVSPQDAFDRLFNETHMDSNAPLASTPLSTKIVAPVQKLGTYNCTLTEEQRKRMEYNKLLATERRKAKLLGIQSTTSDSVYQSQESLTKNRTTFEETTNGQEVIEIVTDVRQNNDGECLTESSSVFDKAVEENTEELELDDLIDLVDEEAEQESIINKQHTTEDNFKEGSQNNRQIAFVDLSNETITIRSVYNKCANVIDLTNEQNRNVSVNNKTIEIINLDNQSITENDKGRKIVEVVDLDCEKPENVNFDSNELEMVDFENYDAVTVGGVRETANSNNSSSIFSILQDKSSELNNEEFNSQLNKSDLENVHQSMDID